MQMTEDRPDNCREEPLGKRPHENLSQMGSPRGCMVKEGSQVLPFHCFTVWSMCKRGRSMGDQERSCTHTYC